MTADPDALRFYADESALGLGKTLCAARKDTIYAGHPLIPECPLGAPDTVWMRAVADRGLVALVRDKRIRTRPLEIERFREVGLRVFWLGGKRDLATWGYLEQLVRHWGTIERIVNDEGPGPWGYVITKSSVEKLL
ncbi:MAG: hypothetical protein WD844_08015 [Thermoleophilaceae bacterium]